MSAPLSRRALVAAACTSILVIGAAATANLGAQAAEPDGSMTPITTVTTVAPPWPGFAWPDVAWSSSPQSLPMAGSTTLTFTATETRGGSFTGLEGALCPGWSADATGPAAEARWAEGDCIVQDAASFSGGVAAVDLTIQRGSNEGTNLRGERREVTCLNEEQCSIAVRITNSLNTDAQYWWDPTWFVDPTTTTLETTTTLDRVTTTTTRPGQTTDTTRVTTTHSGPSTTQTSIRTTTRPPTTPTTAGPTTTRRPSTTVTSRPTSTTSLDLLAFFRWLICALFGC